MKRFLFFAFALCLCFPNFASAESLFPSLSTPAPTVGDKAPSYGGMASVDPDDIQPYAEGGQVVTYENVDEQGYNDFGVYLNQLGFEVVVQNVIGRTAEMKLSDGKFNIGMVYYGKEQKMVLIYEEGVEFEKRDVFKNYSRIKFEDEIDIKGLGKICLKKFCMNESVKLANYFSADRLWPDGYYSFHAQTWMLFQFYNITLDEVPFYYGDIYRNYGTAENTMWNGIGMIQLHYINKDDHYIIPMDKFGRYAHDAILTCDTNTNTVSSLTTCDLGISFDAPEGVMNADDGMLAISFDFTTGEKYILILREDGQKVGDW